MRFNKIPKKEKTIGLNIYIMFILPCIIIMAAIIFSIALNYISNKNNLQNYAQIYIKQFMNESEQKINSVISAACILSSHTDISEIVDSDTLQPNDKADAAMKQLMQTYSCIDSIFVYSSEQNTVEYNNNIYSSEDFFTNNYKYDIYNTSYWDNLRFYNSASYKVLLPTTVFSDNSKKSILPVVIRSDANHEFKNNLVINLNLHHIILTSTIPKISDNSEVYIFNRYNNSVFNSNMELLDHTYSDDFYEKLMEKNSNTFKYKIDSKTSMINSFSNTSSLNGYTYFVITPYKDIFSRIRPMLLLDIMISIMFIIVAVFVAFTNASSTVVPLMDLSKIFSVKHSNENIILQIKKRAMELYEQNIHLKETLPMAQAKYLIDFLNNADYLTDDKTKDLIKKSLPFHHSFYAVVIIRISFENTLYDVFNSSECARIKYGLYDLIKELFNVQIDSFMLSGERDELYIIANSDTDNNNNIIDSVINSIKTALLADANELTLSIGKSKFYNDMDGLKKAHEEAVTSLNVVELSSTHINTKKGTINFIFESADENSLFNALIGYKTDIAISIVNNIASRNAGADSRSKQQLYHHILNIILKVIKLKNIPFKNDKLDFEIYNMILNLPPDEMHSNIISILEYIKKYSIKNNVDIKIINSNINNIIDYIDKNYTNAEMSLDMVASVFNISAPNLSSLIKNNLGIGFHDYIINLRIEKSKGLLLESNDSISKISSECGFGSEKTFFRIFKKKVGMTSGEFRERGKE